MRIIKVSCRKTRKKFLDVAKILYKNDKIWVCPFNNEIEAVFDPKRNPYWKHGEAERWILEDDNNILIGRIAAFIDNRIF
jgi:hypothetical protein